MKRSSYQVFNILNTYRMQFLETDNIKLLTILDKATSKISNCKYKTDIVKELRKLRGKNVITSNDFTLMTDEIY